jgi:hypothetical protein
MNVKLKTPNRISEPTGPAKPDETNGLTGTGPGLGRHDSARLVFGRVWNQTNLFLQFKPRRLVGYLDQLSTLNVSEST